MNSTSFDARQVLTPLSDKTMAASEQAEGVRKLKDTVDQLIQSKTCAYLVDSYQNHRSESRLPPWEVTQERYVQPTKLDGNRIDINFSFRASWPAGGAAVTRSAGVTSIGLLGIVSLAPTSPEQALSRSLHQPRLDPYETGIATALVSKLTEMRIPVKFEHADASGYGSGPLERTTHKLIPLSVDLENGNIRFDVRYSTSVAKHYRISPAPGTKYDEGLIFTGDRGQFLALVNNQPESRANREALANYEITKGDRDLASYIQLQLKALDLPSESLAFRRIRDAQSELAQKNFDIWSKDPGLLAVFFPPEAIILEQSEVA